MDAGTRIVLIDDDEDDYLLTRDMLDELAAQPYTLEWVANAEDARTLMASDPPDICLLDYRLGADDGIALIPELLSGGFDGPIIMLTGQRDRALENAALKAGAADYLSKQHINAYDLERSLRYAWMRKRAETQARERLAAESRQREAEAASLAKSRFLASISHELRTPLAAMLGYSDLLSLKTPDGELADYSNAIARNGRHLQVLLDDMLDLSLIESGKLDLDIVDTSIRQLISDVASTAEIQCRRKGLDFALELPKTLPDGIATDKKRLSQMLFNLVGNAIKFTDTGSIVLRVRYDPGNLGVVVFEIEDTGPGIDKADLGSIFEPVHRLRACFTLTMPVPASTERQPVDPAEIPNPDVAARLTAVLDGFVLIVDDVEDIRSSVAGLLRSVGARVATLSSGNELLNRLESTIEQQPDLILLDMQMPRLNGYETAQRIRASGLEIPILALTATVLEGSREHCLAAGCDDYLSKPLEPARLFERVAHWLGSAGARGRPASDDPAASATQVLIVDDAADGREAMRELLTLAGFSVQTAATEEEAEAAVAEVSPESIILDLKLGTGSGIDLARRIRSRESTAGIKLLGLSGRPAGYLSSEERALFDVYMTKPVDCETLMCSLDGCGVRPGTRPTAP